MEWTQDENGIWSATAHGYELQVNQTRDDSATWMVLDGKIRHGGNEAWPKHANTPESRAAIVALAKMRCEVFVNANIPKA